MPSAPSVTFDDLESALQWVSAGAPFENSAFISKSTGQIFYSSSVYDTEDELPEDLDERWYEYEKQATKIALLAWASDERLILFASWRQSLGSPPCI